MYSDRAMSKFCFTPLHSCNRRQLLLYVSNIHNLKMIQNKWSYINLPMNSNFDVQKAIEEHCNRSNHQTNLEPHQFPFKMTSTPGSFASQFRSIRYFLGIEKPTRKASSKQTAKTKNISIKGEVLLIVAQLLNEGQNSAQSYYLVSFKDCIKSHGELISTQYKNYALISHVRSTTEARWLVFSYALSGGCPLMNSILKLNTNYGTSNIITHAESHKKDKIKEKLILFANHMSRKKIWRDAAVAQRIRNQGWLNFQISNWGKSVSSSKSWGRSRVSLTLHVANVQPVGVLLDFVTF